MRWTPDLIEELKTKAICGMSNADLAAYYGVPVQEIHAVRSRHNITRAKLAAELAHGAEPECVDESVIEKHDIKQPAHPLISVYVEELSRFLRDSALLDIVRCYLLPEELVCVDMLDGRTFLIDIEGHDRAQIAIRVIESILKCGKADA